MTWIAACSGQRGIYQEVIMNDEERQLICAVLRQMGGYWYRHPDGSTRDVAFNKAADEIERLVEERDEARRIARNIYPAIPIKPIYPEKILLWLTE